MFWVFPCVVDLSGGEGAAKEEFDLVKVAVWVMKFVGQARVAHPHGQSRFFMDFAGEVFGQALVQFRAAARCTPQIATPLVGVDQKEFVFVHKNAAHGEADGAFHERNLDRIERSGKSDLIISRSGLMLRL